VALGPVQWRQAAGAGVEGKLFWAAHSCRPAYLPPLASGSYGPVPPLRVTGLLTVPAVGAEGCAGVVAQAAGRRRGVWAVADVATGG
jgi:hypothetical protein